MIVNRDRELTLVYHPEKYDNKKALAFVESLQGYTVKTFDLARNKITPTQLGQIANKLDCEAEGLLDVTYIPPETEGNKEKSNINSLKGEDILVYLASNPVLIKTPIIILADKAYLYNSAYEIVKEELANKSSDKI